MSKTVTTIPAKCKQDTQQEVKKRRVAGYARVSTDTDDQATSFEAQVNYYTKYIKMRDDWEFVDIYTDEGITATNTKNREGFNRMIEDALNGKIDLIITKSVSRFARNTVDSLTTVRKLKDKGIEIYFEKENIWTLDSKGELLITIMSSLAQEESRSISENTKWGKRKRFADGKGSVGYSSFLGYDKDFKVNEEQKKIVQLIFNMFIAGYSCPYIRAYLNDNSIRTPTGRGRWHTSAVQSILENEKYKGDALLQKSYTKDFLNKKRYKNNGEIPQYYVEDHHEAIIDKNVFDYVQYELNRRKGIVIRNDCVLSGRIRCAECGGVYGRKTWHSNDPRRKLLWQCNDKYKVKGVVRCHTPHVYTEQLHEMYIEAMNEIWQDKDNVIETASILKEKMANPIELIEKQEKIERQVNKMVDKLNVKGSVTDADYAKRYDEQAEKYHKKLDELKELKLKVQATKAQAVMIEDFINHLQKLDKPVTEFEDALFLRMVQDIWIHESGKIEFKFRGGFSKFFPA